MRQMVNAMAPTNFAFTNPEVLRKTVETQGENLLQGLQMMVEDKKKSADLRGGVPHPDPDGAVVGEQILHLRSDAEVQHGELPARTGLHGVHDLVAEPR
jgi:poly(3-hydroxyalkanoate) synthetase